MSTQGKTGGNNPTVRFNDKTAEPADITYKPVPADLARVISGNISILRANVMLEGRKVEVLEIVERYRSWKMIGMVGVAAAVVLGIAALGTLGLLLLLMLSNRAV